jgi:cephalosporin hydroxylase
LGDRTRVVSEFHRLWYNRANTTWKSLRWCGVPVQKCPFDLWMYQEILTQVRPEAIIETGTLYGGSALFLAHCCDLLGVGEVLTIDRARIPGWTYPEHPRLTYVIGDSVAPGIRAVVQAWVAARAPRRVCVVLDSDHRAPHVVAELEAYAPYVTLGGYCIVEDSNLNGRPVWPTYGPGPAEALAQWLPQHPEFTVAREWERLLLTFNPGGYLRRVG